MTIEQQTAVVRSFNRSYTQRIGVLEESFLGMGTPVSHERLLVGNAAAPSMHHGSWFKVIL